MQDRAPESGNASGRKGDPLNIDRDLRKATYDLVENTIIDLTVLVVVVLSVVLVQIDTKSQPIFLTEMRTLINMVLLRFLGIETSLKIYAYGLFLQSGVSPRSIEFPKDKPPFVSATEEGSWNSIEIGVVMMMVLIALPIGIIVCRCVV